MNRRSFFKKLIVGLAAVPVVGKLFAREDVVTIGGQTTITKIPPGCFVDLRHEYNEPIRRPGIRPTKWQPPKGAHGFQFHGDNLWWLETDHPQSIFFKPLSEILDGGGSEYEVGFIFQHGAQQRFVPWGGFVPGQSCGFSERQDPDSFEA